MASEVDSELTSASIDSSSGSLLGEKTTGEGGSIHDTASSGHPHESQPQINVSENEKMMTPIPSSPQSGNNPQSKSVIKKDEDNVDKPEKTGEEKTTPILSSPQSGNDPQSESVIKKDEDNVDEPEKTGGEMMTLIPSSPQSGNNPQSESVIKKDEDNVDKPEKTGGEKTTPIPSSTQSGNDPQSESVIKKDEDNVDEPEKTGGEVTMSEMSLHHWVSDIATLWNKEKMTPIPSSPQSGNDPQSESVIKKDEDNVDKPEKTGGEEDESPVKMQTLKETEKPRDINDRGDGFKHTDEADKDKDQDQNMISEPEPGPSLKENSGNIQRTNEDETASDINERGEHTDETDDMSENKDQDPVTEESLQQNASSGLPQDNRAQISVGCNDKLFFAVVVLLVSCCVALYFSDSTLPEPKEFNVVDVFNQEMEQLKINFPNQRPELWRRSLIHIRRHLKTEHPTEPVSLILTSGHGAERTLDCLARCLAQAFSTARNSSFLNIDGKSKASQDSDQVKLDIDSELRNAFEGKKFAAVIHRFEELPPGSTLIFYRYCDHENAAYKNVFLAFTVMLEGEVEVPSNVNLGRVEEMVQEHVKQKFVSSDKLATFNQMDVDKLSGLWSRISHLILPVAAEKKIELQGCGYCDKSF